ERRGDRLPRPARPGRGDVRDAGDRLAVGGLGHGHPLRARRRPPAPLPVLAGAPRGALRGAGGTHLGRVQRLQPVTGGAAESSGGWAMTIVLFSPGLTSPGFPVDVGAIGPPVLLAPGRAPRAPGRRPELVIRPLGDDGQHVVKDPATGGYFRLGAQE